MAMEKRLGVMVEPTKVLMLRAKSTETANSVGVMALLMKESLSTMIFKVKDATAGKMDASTSAPGKKIKCMDTESSPGSMAENLKVST